MDAVAPIVLQSAARHGVAEEDALHAWAFAIDAYNVGEGMVMYIGPDRAGDRACHARPPEVPEVV